MEADTVLRLVLAQPQALYLLGRWTATVSQDRGGEPVTTSTLMLTLDMVEDVLDHASWAHGDQPRAGWFLQLRGGMLVAVVLLGAPPIDGSMAAQIHAAAGTKEDLAEWMLNWVVDGATDHAPSVKPFIGSLV